MRGGTPGGKAFRAARRTYSSADSLPTVGGGPKPVPKPAAQIVGFVDGQPLYAAVGGSGGAESPDRSRRPVRLPATASAPTIAQLGGAPAAVVALDALPASARKLISRPRPATGGLGEAKTAAPKPKVVKRRTNAKPAPYIW